MPRQATARPEATVRRAQGVQRPPARPIVRVAVGAVAALWLAVAPGCSDESPSPVTLFPTTTSTSSAGSATGSTAAGTPDGSSGAGTGDGGAAVDTGGGDTGDTTADEQTDPCNDLGRAWYAALGSEGPADQVQPLYDAVTGLLPEEARADWQLASAAFVAYSDAAAKVPEGDDVLADPDAEAAYDRASSTEVQDALARVRTAADTLCPGSLT